MMRPPKKLSVFAALFLSIIVFVNHAFAQSDADHQRPVQYKGLNGVANVEVTTEVGVLPHFPHEVPGRYSDRATHPNVRVIWPSPTDNNVVAKRGSYIVTGKVPGTSFAPKATVRVVETSSGETNPTHSLEAFPLGQVKLAPDQNGNPTLFMQHRDKFFSGLLKTNPDRFLYVFRDAFGQEQPGGVKPLGVWDSQTVRLRGHATGHYLSALAQAYASTSYDPKLQAQFAEKMQYMIDALYQLSQMSGKPASADGPFNDDPTKIPPGPANIGYNSDLSKDGIRTDYWNWGKGFISGYPPDQFIMLEQGASYGDGNHQVWAPYYTLHKILAGLVDCYEVGGNPKALDVARNMGLWVYERLKVLPQETRLRMWNSYIAGEYGGMNEVMARLDRITDDERFLDAAKLFDNTNFFFGDSQHQHGLAKNVDTIRGRHANQHIPQIIGALETYRNTQENPYYDVATNFWDICTHSYMYSIGGVAGAKNPSNPECFTAEPNTLFRNGLSEGGQNETCATYNLLKLGRGLFVFDQDAKYMDYYERAIYNHVLASVDEDNPGNTYHVPLNPGARKDFGNARMDGFTCCNGTALESGTKLQDSIYFKSGDNSALYVNLFVPSTLDWKARGVKLTQSTRFPFADTTTLTLQGGGDFAMFVRVPQWADQGYFVVINGEEQENTATPGTYLQLNRKWHDGDTIELKMPMSFHLRPLMDQPNIASLFYGPVLLAAEEPNARSTFRDVTLDIDDFSQSILGDRNRLHFQIGETKLKPFFEFYDGFHSTYLKIKPASRRAAIATEAMQFETTEFRLKLDPQSQNVIGLEPKSIDAKWKNRSFDFTPADQLSVRRENGFHHLGDMTILTRSGHDTEWKMFDSSANRRPVESIEVEGVLAAADLSPTFGRDFPLQVLRSWLTDDDGSLVMQVELINNSDEAVTIGGLEFPAVFNNMIFDFTKKQPRSLEEAHAVCSFVDPYIGYDAGYLQISRLTGTGKVLLVIPSQKHPTPLEAFRPVPDRSWLGQTFEGISSWVVYSKAWKETQWQDAEPWNKPTSVTLKPGDSVTHALRFVLADGLRDIDQSLMEANQPIALGVPGYIVPMNTDVQLFLKPNGRSIKSIESEPAESLCIKQNDSIQSGWIPVTVRGDKWGRSRIHVTYDDDTEQTVHYYVTKPFADAFGDLGDFLYTKQWFDDKDDPFDRDPSIITFDRSKDRQVTQELRVWFAGLSDEAGSGSWVAGTMKQFGLPDREQVAKLARFVDETVWGGLQFREGPKKYGVKKSLFFYEPKRIPDFDYIDGDWSSWTSWNKEHADDTGRSYNYPHVAVAHWTMYRLMRNHPGLIENAQHDWQWYLDKAFNTGKFLGGGFGIDVGWRNMGLMEGSVFKHILDDLRHEGWKEQADELESLMRKRADHWESLQYPYGSEMAWDSTGQEEVYTWCKHFGFDKKAEVTLNAVLAYMPTVPHWGYNGNARRYWDFIYGGAPNQGIERQIHHYGSGLNSIPVLDAFRCTPDDFYLLRVGYGGSSGALSAIDQEGFAACAFHSNPARLKWDDYSGDNGPNFFGHATTVGSYLVQHPELGWLGFGGNIQTDQDGGDGVTLTPYDTFRQRVYLAPLGLYLTLDAGRFQSVKLNPNSGAVTLVLDSADEYTTRAVIRIEQPGAVDVVKSYRPDGDLELQRKAWIVPLKDEPTSVSLRTAKR